MSQSEAEQSAIFERLKINAVNLSTQQAAEIVQNSVKQKDETIAAAEEEYNKRLAVAAQLRMQGTEEAILTADKIIEEATRQKDDTISKAEETHQKIISEAKSHAVEHINEVNWETGEVKSKWQTFGDNVGMTWDNIKTDAKNKWSDIKRTISDKVSETKTQITEKCNGIKSSAVDTWNNIKSNTANVWQNIQKSITEPVQNAFNTVRSWIDRIKGLFNFSWSLPKLKLPHFKISGEFSLNPPSVPSFGIDWYKKGAILNDPTIFGLNPFSGNLMVGGEAGAEAIAPIDTLQDYVKQAVNEGENNNVLYSIITGIFELLKKYLPTISSQKLVLDTGAIVGELSPYIDYNLGNINALKVRGN